MKTLLALVIISQSLITASEAQNSIAQDQVKGPFTTYDPLARNRQLNALDFPPGGWLGYGLDMRRGQGVDQLIWDTVRNLSATCRLSRSVA